MHCSATLCIPCCVLGCLPRSLNLEHKRRGAIRSAFDRLATLVPGQELNARREAIILMATVEYLQDLLVENQRLRQTIIAAGVLPVCPHRPEIDNLPALKIALERFDHDQDELEAKKKLEKAQWQTKN